jgi:hypothetical protein
MKIPIFAIFAASLTAFGSDAPHRIVGGNTPYLPQSVADAAVGFDALYPDHSYVLRATVQAVNEEQKVIDLVPGSGWRAGCVPTSVAMLFMYWDILGFSDLMKQDGSNYQFTNAVNLDLIANQQHYSDYFYPDDSGRSEVIPDKSDTYPKGVKDEASTTHFPEESRLPQCIADMLCSSFSSQGARAGATHSAFLIDPLKLNAWVKRANPNYVLKQREITMHTSWLTDRWFTDGVQDKAQEMPYADMWNFIVSEINASRPLLCGVHTEDKTYTPHEMVIVGYRITKEGEKFYAAKNTWQTETVWYRYRNYENTREIMSMAITDLISFEFVNTGPVSPASFSPYSLYRFKNRDTGAWFFSAAPDEVHAVWSLAKNWVYEGPAFKVERTKTKDNSEVYRFFNKRSKSHFYTISAQERDEVIQNLSHTYTYEGVAFYGKTWRGPNEDPVYRFFLPQTGSHYFSNSADETRYLILYGDRSYIQFEGVAWFAEPPLEDNSRNRSLSL